MNLPEDLSILVIIMVVFTVVKQVTGFILKGIFIIALLAFLYYMYIEGYFPSEFITNITN